MPVILNVACLVAVWFAWGWVLDHTHRVWHVAFDAAFGVCSAWQATEKNETAGRVFWWLVCAVCVALVVHDGRIVTREDA